MTEEKKSPFKGPEAHEPAPIRKKTIEAANTLVELGRVVGNLRHKPGAETLKVNRKLFSIAGSRVKRVRKLLAKLEVEYNREGLV